MTSHVEYPILESLLDYRSGHAESTLIKRILSAIQSIDQSSFDSFIEQIDFCIAELDKFDREETFSKPIQHTIFDVYFMIRRVAPAAIGDTLRGLLLSYRNLITDYRSNTSALSTSDWENLLRGMVVAIEVTVASARQIPGEVRAYG